MYEDKGGRREEGHATIFALRALSLWRQLMSKCLNVADDRFSDFVPAKCAHGGEAGLNAAPRVDRY